MTDPRTAILCVRLTPAEMVRVREVAGDCLSDWLRELVLRAAAEGRLSWE